MNSDLVTVIIPTYNRAHLLLNALNSVLRQTTPVHEIIVVDDGSTDDTPRIVCEFLTERRIPDDRVRFLHQANQGKSAALNHGMARATGEWIAILDSDDFWLPQKMELQWRAIRECGEDCGVCFTDAEFTNDPETKLTAFQKAGKFDGRELGSIPDALAFILDHPHGVYIQTVLMRADVLRKVGEFDVALRISEDTDYLFRLALVTRFCYFNRPLVQIDRAASRTGSLTELIRKDSVRIEQRQHMYWKWLSLAGDRPMRYQRYIRKELRGALSEEVNLHLLNGDPKRAIEAMDRVRAFQGSSLGSLKWAAMRLAPELVAKGVRLRARLVKPKGF
jgi:glycosyltransferase involved in cell wall biosynthesis